MTPESILLPSIAMFLWTVGCIFYLGYHRSNAVRRRDVRISFYRAYNKGEQPHKLHILSRHIQNHFEIPPLFHLAVALTYVTDSTTTLTLVLAWIFVASRVLHTFIHLGSNNVNRRFFVFGFGLICVTGIWINLLVQILS